MTARLSDRPTSGVMASTPATPTSPASGTTSPPPVSPGAPTDGTVETLLGIGKAAEAVGVSERALRYYQQIGLLTPSGRTPGGLRRYSSDDLDRVRRIRELQTLLGFNLDEVRTVFANEDRLTTLRGQYQRRPTPGRRRDLIAEKLVLEEQFRATVAAKLAGLQSFLDDLDSRVQRLRDLLAEDHHA